MDWWSSLVVPLLVGACAGALGLARRRAARRRGQRARTGAAFRCPAWLGGRSRRATPGHLTVGPAGAVTWSSRRPFPARTVVLDGLEPTRARPSGDHPSGLGVAVPVHHAGGPGRLWMSDADVATVRRLGAGGPAGERAGARAGAPPTAPHVRQAAAPAPAAAPRRPRRRLAWAVLLLGVLWLAGWDALTVVGGDRVTGTVRTNDGEDCCSVSYVQDGRAHNAGVDCGDERPGDPLEIWAVGWPFTGNAVDTSFSPWFLAGTGWAATALGAFLVLRPRRSDRDDRGDLGSAGDLPRWPAHDLAPLAADQLTPGLARAAAELLATWHPYAVASLPEPAGWEDDRHAAGAGPPRLVPRLVGATAPPLLVLAVLLGLLSPAPYRALVLATSDLAVAPATSTGTTSTDGALWVPGETRVRIDLPGGGSQDADVSSTRELPEGTAVRVTYAVDRPGWARLDSGGAGDGRTLWTLATIVLLLLAWWAWRVRGTVVERRGHRAALTRPARPCEALLVADLDEDPVLLVVDPLVLHVRAWLVPVRPPLPLGTVACAARAPLRVAVRGELREGGYLLVEHDRATMVPLGVVLEADADVLRDLLDPFGADADDGADHDARTDAGDPAGR